MKPLLVLTNVSKTYKLDGEEIHALKDLNLMIHEGELIAIMGPSGSGKSTLMHIAGLLDTPTAGNVYLQGKKVDDLKETETAKLRNKAIGFVFQQFNLLPKIPTWENVALPLLYAGIKAGERWERAKRILDVVGLGDRLQSSRSQLSGGQQQRVAIARALINNPAIIFADEPTGNLDSKSGEQVMNLLVRLNREGRTIVIVTHEYEVAKYAKRQVILKDGQIVFDDLPRKQKEGNPGNQLKKKKERH